MDWKGRRQSENTIDIRAIQSRMDELNYKLSQNQISSKEFEELSKLQQFISSIADRSPAIPAPTNEDQIRGRWQDFIEGRTGSVLQPSESELKGAGNTGQQPPAPNNVPIPTPRPGGIPIPTPRPSFASGGLVGLLPDSMMDSPLVNQLAANNEMAQRNLLRSTETQPKKMSIMDEMRLGLYNG